MVGDTVSIVLLAGARGSDMETRPTSDTPFVLDFITVGNGAEALALSVWSDALEAAVIAVDIAAIDHTIAADLLEGIGAGNALSILVDATGAPDFTDS